MDDGNAGNIRKCPFIRSSHVVVCTVGVSGRLPTTVPYQVAP